MSDFNFTITQDNSVGLFDNNILDIYHSITGAKTEALDKFVNPVSFIKKENINILDICYGIGYNSKVYLNQNYKNFNITIDCLDINQELALISPFIKDQINNNFIKLHIVENLIKNFGFTKLYETIKKYTSDFKNFDYFDNNLVKFIIFLSDNYDKNIILDKNNQFLHNIYYSYISNKNIQEEIVHSKYILSVNFYIDDARRSILKLKNMYDIVFLDGFSPQKSPLLWTIDFLLQIKEHLHDDSIIVSYSKSTPFRNALRKLNFCVGKTLINNVDMGTIASLNKSYIINTLNDFDISLLNTRSGIPYKDETLSLSIQEIIKNREIEQNNSNLISHTQFLKKYKK